MQFTNSPLNHADYEKLGDDDAAEHGEGIDGGVADGGIVAGNDVVGVVEGHGIGHAPA
jgi:hypothetical protein